MVTAPDLLTLLNALHRDAMVGSFRRSGLTGQISKIHRFLEAALPTYKERCLFPYKPYESSADVEAPILEEGEALAFRHQMVPAQASLVFYALGTGEPPAPPEEPPAASPVPAAGSPPPPPPPPAEPVPDKNYEVEIKEAKEVLFGWAQMESAGLGKTFQAFKDLEREIKASGELSEQKKERDNGLQLVQFRDILKDIGHAFRAPDKLEEDETGPQPVPGES